MDEFGNKSTEELVMDQEGLNASASVESNIEAAMWALDPEAKRLYSDIIKDLALANLGLEDIKAVRRYLDLAYLYKKLGMASDSGFFLRKAYTICVTSLSINAIGLKSLYTTKKDVSFSGTPQKPATGQQRRLLGFIPY